MFTSSAVYAFERNNPYKYVDPTGKIAVFSGGGADAGYGFGVGSSGGIVYTYSPSQKTFQSGLYGSAGSGLSTPSVGIGVERGIAPFVNSLDDFGGQSRDLGFDIGEGITLGLGVSIPYTETKDSEGNVYRDYNYKAFSIKYTLNADLNLPGPFASGYVQDSSTVTKQIYSLSFKSKEPSVDTLRQEAEAGAQQGLTSGQIIRNARARSNGGT